MLLFTEPTLSSDASAWAESVTFDNADLVVEASLDHGRHLVSVYSGDDRAAELVSPTAFRPEDEPVSSFHLPPYYRWERGLFSCRFTAEWRDSAASVAVSLRHLTSLRGHPRALVVDEAGVAVSAIVLGTPSEVTDPETNEPALRTDWRGWYVIEADDPFNGPIKRVLATHTAVRFWGQVPSTSTLPAST